jgi:fermentation-respiration switch protein FrsA (DUF1100 family)
MIHRFPVVFAYANTVLAGRFYRGVPDLQQRQPAILITGSWLTVKEQMAHTYALLLAARGYTVFTFDFSGFGESQGTLRQTELPAQKISDISAAVAFVRTLSFVQPDSVGYLAICASAQYLLAALARGVPVQSFVSVAGWFHDTVSVAPFYGGPAGVERRIAHAGRAAEKFLSTGQLETAPAYREGDEAAGMSFKLDYYANPSRGAIFAWKNEMSVITWMHWLTFDGLTAASAVTTPALLVHGDACALPENARRVYASLKGAKQLVWGKGSQSDYYDQPEFVAEAVEAADLHFKRTLGPRD